MTQFCRVRKAAPARSSRICAAWWRICRCGCSGSLHWHCCCVHVSAPVLHRDTVCLALVQKELELDFRQGISSCHDEEASSDMDVAAADSCAHCRLQLDAARSQAAHAAAAHRSCQSDFLRLERMFNEVLPVEIKLSHTILQQLKPMNPSLVYTRIIILSGVCTNARCLSLSLSCFPQVMQENNQLRAQLLLR